MSQLIRARAPQSKEDEVDAVRWIWGKSKVTAWGRKACSSSLEQATAKGKLIPFLCIWEFSGVLTLKVIMCWFIGRTLVTAHGERDMLWLKPLLPSVKDMKVFLIPLFWSEDSSNGIWRDVSLRNLLSTLVAKNRPWDTTENRQPFSS